jgi:hypothetical protein
VRGGRRVASVCDLRYPRVAMRGKTFAVAVAIVICVVIATWATGFGVRGC